MFRYYIQYIKIIIHCLKYNFKGHAITTIKLKTPTGMYRHVFCSYCYDESARKEMENK